MIKFWCICAILNLLLFYSIKDDAIEAVKTDPRTVEKCKDLTDSQIEKLVHTIMIFVSLTGPLFWIYLIIRYICQK